MQLRIWTYALTPRRRLSALARPGVREGALLRVAREGASMSDGYADIHPWPELGDAPLAEQLALLARGETTPLTRASLRLARIDGDARARGVSLFDGLTIPESHWPGDDPPDAFDTVKLKGASSIPPRVRLRIDFNATLTAEEFVRVAATLPRERVDFIEDPCPYDADIWRELRETTGLRLALDRAATQQPSNPATDVVVHKPAVEEFPRAELEVVVTSYMDHPVGQFGAAYIAATHRVSTRCGLFTHVLYEPNEFIERIRADGACLFPPEGTGIGFDDLLERLPWRDLK